MNTKRILAAIGIAGAMVGAFMVGTLTLGDAFARDGAPNGSPAVMRAAEDGREGADVAVTGEALARASAAALVYTGKGRVTDTEVGDEEGYYEIEVTLENGREIDVHLDEHFAVLGQEAEGVEDK